MRRSSGQQLSGTSFTSNQRSLVPQILAIMRMRYALPSSVNSLSVRSPSHMSGSPVLPGWIPNPVNPPVTYAVVMVADQITSLAAEAVAPCPNTGGAVSKHPAQINDGNARTTSRNGRLETRTGRPTELPVLFFVFNIAPSSSSSFPRVDRRRSWTMLSGTGHPAGHDGRHERRRAERGRTVLRWSFQRRSHGGSAYSCCGRSITEPPGTGPGTVSSIPATDAARRLPHGRPR